ncbi:hypothetical protein QBC46DRAFT_453401 [Diplogelasinospora grovesii]|uniref:Uncharacterized protein n=1 Tax=Diplogelasinospora grovesii TaxID=303347 RepID=A0AAN6MY66_9PEZI|nr:hypothetical protein QBC46DRAFT_453401 [Diplogelasinospora grovesii]
MRAMALISIWYSALSSLLSALRVSHLAERSPPFTTMLAMRIDNFDGDDRAYAGYLFRVLTEILPEQQLVHQLEERTTYGRLGNWASNAAYRVEIEFWKPSSSPRNKKKKNMWVGRTATFFNELPKSETEWNEKRKAARLFETEDILSAVDWLKTGRPSSNIPFTDHTQKPDLQDILISLGQNAGMALASSSFSRNVSQFLSLVFIATCYVAVEKGHPENLVDDAQVAFMKTSYGKFDGGHLQLKKDRITVQWLLEEMQCGKAINFYSRCPHGGEANDLFTERFPCCDVPDEKQASLPFWIPFFVQLHISDLCSYSTTCRALRVDLLDQEEDFHRFSETLRSRKLVVCRLEESHPRHPPDQPRKRRLGRKPTTQTAKKSDGRGGQTPHAVVGSALGQGGSGFQAHLEEATLVRGDESTSTTQFQPINGGSQDRGRSTASTQFHPRPAKRRRPARDKSNERDIKSNGPNRHGSEFSDHSMPAGDGATVGWIQDTGTDAIGEAVHGIPVQAGMSGSLPPTAFGQAVPGEYHNGIGGPGGVPSSTERAGHVSGIAPAQNDANMTMLLIAANCAAMPFADPVNRAAGGSLSGRADHREPRRTTDDNGRISTDVPFGQSGNPDGRAAITESPNIEDGGPTAPVDSEAGNGTGPADLSCYGQDATWGRMGYDTAAPGGMDIMENMLLSELDLMNWSL